MFGRPEQIWLWLDRYTDTKVFESRVYQLIHLWGDIQDDGSADLINQLTRLKYSDWKILKSILLASLLWMIKSKIVLLHALISLCRLTIWGINTKLYFQRWSESHFADFTGKSYCSIKYTNNSQHLHDNHSN